MKLLDVLLKVQDDNGREIVLGKNDMLNFEITGTANYLEYISGGPWAKDGRTRRHQLHWGNDWTFTVTLTHRESIPAAETTSEPY